MNAPKIVLICVASALAAAAQTAPPSQRVAPQPAARAASPFQKHGRPQGAKAKARKAPASRPVKAVAKAAVRTSSAAGKRDPFISPVREAGPAGPNCSVGKKCLAIDSVVLRGIVEAPNGAIAVVESSARKVTYFLRENDPVFNGFVVKITPDSIVFRENVMDRLGRESTRDVVKKVSAPAV